MKFLPVTAAAARFSGDEAIVMWQFNLVEFMLTRLKSILHSAARRLVIVPLRVSGARLRSEALEQLANTMIFVAPIPGGSLKFFAPTPLLRARAATVLDKEPDMIQWIESFAAHSVFWDIGANVGVFSLYAAMCENALVLAFEPSAANFHVLSRNIQLNNLSERVIAYCVAFSDCTQLGVLNLAAPEMGGACSQFGRVGEKSRYASDSLYSAQGMLGMAIDDLIAQFAPPFPNYLKIDVDGLEWPILRGARKTLSDARLRSAMIELSVSNQAERKLAIDFLHECGLRLKGSGEVQGTTSAQAANHLFQRNA